MNKHYIIDAHEDIADSMLYAAHGNFWRENGLHEGWNDLNLPVNNQSDFPRLKKGNVKAIFGVSCAFDVGKNGEILPCTNHLHETLKQINLYHRLLNESKGKVNLIRSTKDLTNINEYDLSFLLALEGADSIDDELVNLETFFNLGVRSIGLTWSFNNNLAGGCNEDGNLTKLGMRVIKRMEELGIILDLSHLNEKSSVQAINSSKKPMIISHTACLSVYKHPRNVSDKLMKKVVNAGGAIGICGVPQFMSEKPTIGDVVKHFDHAIKTVGIKNVIFGTDFGSMTKPNLVPKYSQVSEISNLLNLFKSELRLSSRDLELLTHKNLERILANTLPKK